MTSRVQGMLASMTSGEIPCHVSMTYTMNNQMQHNTMNMVLLTMYGL